MSVCGRLGAVLIGGQSGIALTYAWESTAYVGILRAVSGICRPGAVAGSRMLRTTNWTNWRGEAHSDIAAVSLFTGLFIIHSSGEASSVNTPNLYRFFIFSAAFYLMISTHNSLVELFCFQLKTEWNSLNFSFSLLCTVTAFR